MKNRRKYRPAEDYRADFQKVNRVFVAKIVVLCIAVFIAIVYWVI